MGYETTTSKYGKPVMTQVMYGRTSLVKPCMYSEDDRVVPLKCLYLSHSLQGIITQKTDVFLATTVKASNLTQAQNHSIKENNAA